MKNRKSKTRATNVRLIGAVLLVLTVLLITTWPITGAAEGETAGSSDTATLKVHLVYSDIKGDKPVAGATFAIYSVYEFDSEMHYTLTSDFASVDVPAFDELTVAAQQEEAAKKFASAAKNATPLAKQETDKEGEAVFSGIDTEHFGVYLVIETDRTGDAVKYTIAEPMLVQVPKVTEEEGFEYEVTVLPKISLIPNTPSTGDESNLLLWIGCACLGVAGIVVIILCGKGRRKKTTN